MALNSEALLLSWQEEHDLQDVAARITKAHHLSDPVALVIEVLDPYHSNVVTVSIAEDVTSRGEGLGDMDVSKNKGLESMVGYLISEMEELNKDTDQAIAEYDETVKTVNADIEQRQAWLKAHGYTVLK